jgi:hypothetical protein
VCYILDDRKPGSAERNSAGCLAAGELACRLNRRVLIDRAFHGFVPFPALRGAFNNDKICYL